MKKSVLHQNTLETWKREGYVLFANSSSGFDIVFFPGAAGSPLLWEKAGSVLLQVCQPERIIIPYYPGERGWYCPGQKLYPEPFVNTICQQIENHQLKNPYFLGTSFGALIALLTALSTSIHIKGLILHAPPWNLPRQKLLRSWLSKLQEHQRYRTIGLLFRYWTIIFLAHEVFRLPLSQMISYIRWLRKTLPASVTPLETLGRRIAWLSSLPQSLTPHPLPPTILLLSRKGLDKLVPFSTQEEFMKTWNIQKTYILENMGHLAPWLYPEEFAHVVHTCILTWRDT